MESAIGYLIVVLLAILVVVLFQFNKQLKVLKKSRQEDESQKMLVEWLKDMRGSLDKNLGQVTSQMQKNNQSLNERLDNAARVVGTVSKELGQMNEIGKRMKDLQDFLRSPKLRGNIGERILQDLLEQILPRNSYSLQHIFREGQKVDAIITTDRGIIPIDSKFPMESFVRVSKAENEEEKEREMKLFARVVKKHIDDISKKYILPQEGTVDFALMYIPSEPIYYEIVISKHNINSYAHEKKVLLVSPNSFYYYLRIVLMGLQEKRVAEGARQILKTLEGIRHEASKFETDLSVLSGHLSRAKNSMDTVNSKYQILSGKIEQVKHLEKDAKVPGVE